MTLLLLACAPGGEAGPTGISGRVTAEREGETADVLTGAAYGFHLNGTGIVYVSPDADATCADVATYLSGPGEDWNPDTVNDAAACSLFVDADYSGEAVTYEDDMISAFVALNCAFNEGEWVQEERDQGDEGYYYSGPWWIGSPTGATVSLSGGEADFTLSIEMSAYEGNFVYEEMYEALATGEVSGSTPVTWCSDLGRTFYF